MCGINGIIDLQNKDSLISLLKKMNLLIQHRGPDEDGFFVENTVPSSIGMAMRRLSIIDVNTGKQPIYSNDKQKVIVFNGEIYNYKSLRNNLISEGYVFDTNSDTEVVVNLYDKYGTKSFSMLDGMFAFSIFDKTLHKIFLVRDYFGEKPLYYTQEKGRFLWASELKSILSVLDNVPPIDRTALNLYFQLTYIPAPYSIYDSIFKLEPNHYLEIDCSDLIFSQHEIQHSFRRYDQLSKKDSITAVRRMIQQSVESRSIADVPLGAFLSGGVDSSIISLCLARQSDQKIKTFSIGFEKKSFDESDKARQVAKLIHSDHHEFIISENDIRENVSEIILNFDEPFADSSALATYLVAKKTSEHVTVALTGDGGDEVFGGYNKYYIGKLNQKYTSVVPRYLNRTLVNLSDLFLKTKDDNRGYRFKLSRLLKAVNYDGDFYYNIISLGFQDEEIKQAINASFYKHDSLRYYKSKIGMNNKTLTDFRNIDRLLSLEGDMLVKVDRTSMLTSLECRAPFLNKELWNFTNQLPENYLLNGWDKKHILKEAFKSEFPEGFLDKTKKGFGVPVGDWLRVGFKTELEYYINREFIRRQGIFNFEYIDNLVKNHLSGKIDNTFRVWTFYCFQKWYVDIYSQK